MIITQAYYDARNRAMEWLNSKQDFATGLKILLDSGYKPLVAGKIAKWGDKPFSREKLIHEVRMMIQVWANPNDPKHLDAVFADEDPEAGQPETSLTEEVALSLVAKANELINASAQEGDENQLPAIISRLIYMFADDYKARSIMHKQLSDMPDDNTELTMANRKSLVTGMKALSAHMDRLHELKVKWELEGVLPKEEDLAISYEDPDTVDDADADKVAANIELPANVDELKKMRKSEATKLSRARNMLEYQCEAKPKDKKKNPLPDSPKKVKYEKKVSFLTELISRIDYKIAELA